MWGAWCLLLAPLLTQAFEVVVVGGTGTGKSRLVNDLLSGMGVKGQIAVERGPHLRQSLLGTMRSERFCVNATQISLQCSMLCLTDTPPLNICPCLTNAAATGCAGDLRVVEHLWRGRVPAPLEHRSSGRATRRI
eukprot:Sspe_Gene.118142::Locus_110940_Transcript_1_1_Confidence_1.000_Length_448::g.118142::m.118142